MTVTDAVDAPVVSVIVPTYGRPQYLQSALWSVMLQTFTDWECIIVDDAGGQPHEFPCDARFRWIDRSSNGGPGAARNTGIAAARGQYLAFLDDDDVLTPTRLHSALDVARRDPTAIAIVQHARFDESGVVPLASHGSSARAQEKQFADQFPHVGQTLTPRNRVQLFDESLRTAEDAEWWLRVAMTGPLRVTMDLGYLLRQHAELRPGIRSETTLQNRIRVYEKHRDLLAHHRRARAFAADRVASAALLLGDRKTSVAWATRSLRARPNIRALRVLRRALVLGQARSPDRLR